MSTNRLPQWLAVLPVYAALLLIATLPLIEWLHSLRWHDQQRLGQVAALAVVALFSIFTGLICAPPPTIDRRTRTGLAALVFAGVLSAALARQPLWAFAELAIAVGSLGLGWMIALARLDAGPMIDRAIIATLFTICTALTLQFFVIYAAALIVEGGRVDAWVMLRGFSHPRFYGQFISLSLPLLAVPILTRERIDRFAAPALVLLVLWWTIAISSGTRGTWLGLVAAMALLTVIGPASRRWTALNIAAGVAAFALFWLLMHWMPQWAGVPLQNYAGDRMTTSLSLREGPWRLAIEMIMARPLLGFGPMHFADIVNPVAAHPHQAWLQWASEWGVPSALTVTWLVWRAGLAVFRVMREKAESRSREDVLRVCLSAAVTASLVQSMVDGVLVMPYTVVWLTIVGGWLLALHPRAVPLGASSQRWRWGWPFALTMSATLLVFLAVRDVPRLQQREKDFLMQRISTFFQPRFWVQGVIGDPQDVRRARCGRWNQPTLIPLCSWQQPGIGPTVPAEKPAPLAPVR